MRALLPTLAGLCLLTVLGSLSARKYNRPSLLLAIASGLAAAGAALSGWMILPTGFPGPFPPGTLPLAVSLLPILAIAEKFGQGEAHRASLFATVAAAAATVSVAWAQGLPAFGMTSVPPLLPPWISLVTLAAYLTGSNLAVVLYHMGRVLGGGRHFWIRSSAAILLGGCMESFMNVPMAWAGREPLGPLLAGRLALWALVAIVAIPFLAAHRAVQGPRAIP